MDSVPAPEHSVNINNGHKTIVLRDGTSLLAGLARNGIFVPSACGGNARCGCCKVKVRGAGPVTPAEEPLVPESERAAGIRLSCQVKVHGNLDVTLPYDVLKAQRCTAKLIHKELLTYDIVRCTLQLIKPDSLNFTAGQYIQVRSQPYDGHESVLRNYSIASPPSSGNIFDLMIRRVPNGVCTGWVFDKLAVGDTMSFTAPFGRFKLSASNAPILFVAGGSGMGPIYAILRDMQEKGIRRTAYYFFGALTQNDLFLLKELHELTDTLPDFTFIPAVSNEPANSSWTGERGLITDVLARHFPDCSQFEGYLCGSPGMIAACKKVLLAGNMPDNHIFYDTFA